MNREHGPDWYVRSVTPRLELEAEIDRLRAELAETRTMLRDALDDVDSRHDRAKKAEARLAAVVALCDAYASTTWDDLDLHNRRVRAAATGELT